MHRRQFLIGASALGAQASSALGAARKPGRPPVPGRLIDVHHHILPPGAPPALAALMGDWSPSAALDGMDRAGIAVGIAYPGPILVGEPPRRRALARAWNDFGALLGHDHKGRFGLFGSLPLPDVEGCLAEIDYGLDVLKADGFGMASSYGDLWLGDPALWPIYEKLNDRKAVVFVHPNDAKCCAPAEMTYVRPGMDGSWIDWPMNTARTIFSLMTTGALHRYPDIRFIFSHGGGVMPLLVERLAGFKAWSHVGEAGLNKAFPDGVETAFRRLYFECAQACTPTNMNALRSLVPDSNILFGTDFPFFPLAYGAAAFGGLHLPSATAAAIGRGNAARLLPRWA